MIDEEDIAEKVLAFLPQTITSEGRKIEGYGECPDDYELWEAELPEWIEFVGWKEISQKCKELAEILNKAKKELDKESFADDLRESKPEIFKRIN